MKNQNQNQSQRGRGAPRGGRRGGKTRGGQERPRAPQVQPESKNCNKGFTCKLLVGKVRCKNHSKFEQNISRYYQDMAKKFMQNDGSLACQAVDGTLRVVGFEMVPVISKQEIDIFDDIYYFVVEIKGFDEESQRLQIVIGDQIGAVADLKDEIKVHKLAKFQQFDEYMNKDQIEELNIQVHSGVLIIREFTGAQPFIRADKIGNKYPNFKGRNRALANSRVTFDISRGERIPRVLWASIPKQRPKFGVIKYCGDALVFHPFDNTCSSMIIFKIETSLYNNLSQEQKPFSPNTHLRNDIISQSISDQFLMADFIEWNTHSTMPFCKVKGNDLKLPFGKIHDLDLAKSILLKDFGFDEDDFPKKVKDEAKKVKQQITKKMDSQKEESQIYCFSVDNKNTRAIDDAISIEDIDGQNFRIGIHIADLNEIIKTGGAMDHEAQTKGRSYFIGKHFFKAMLPRDIYANVGSLKPEENRYVVSLYFVINEEGLVDYDSISYRQSIVKNQHKLTYNQVNAILSKPASHSDLDENLASKIIQLSSLMKKRAEFRQEIENPGTKDKSSAESMIEELMLISHTCFPVYYDWVLQKIEENNKIEMEKKRKKKEEEKERKRLKKEEKKIEKERKQQLKEEKKKKKKEKIKSDILKKQNPNAEDQTDAQTEKKKKAEKQKKVKVKKEKVIKTDQVEISEGREEISETDEEEQEQEPEQVAETDDEELSDEQQEEESSSSSSSASSPSESEDETDEEFIDMGSSHDDEERRQKTSLGSENFLVTQFNKLRAIYDPKGLILGDVEFKSRKTIDQAFREYKKVAKDELLRQYLDIIYRQNYQYFPYMLKRHNQNGRNGIKKKFGGGVPKGDLIADAQKATKEADQKIEEKQIDLDPSNYSLENMLERAETVEFMLKMLKRLRVDLGLRSVQMANTPWDFSQWHLTKRAQFLQAPSLECLTKTMILVNYHYIEESKDDPHYPRYVVAIVQQFRQICFQKVQNIAQSYQNSFYQSIDEESKQIGIEGFRFRIATDLEAADLSGYLTNAITPFFMKNENLPIILDQNISELQPKYFWMGGGRISLQTGVSVDEFKNYVGSRLIIDEISKPKETPVDSKDVRAKRNLKDQRKDKRISRKEKKSQKNTKQKDSKVSKNKKVKNIVPNKKEKQIIIENEQNRIKEQTQELKKQGSDMSKLDQELEDQNIHSEKSQTIVKSKEDNKLKLQEQSQEKKATQEVESYEFNTRTAEVSAKLNAWEQTLSNNTYLNGKIPTSLDADALEFLQPHTFTLSPLTHPYLFGWYMSTCHFSEPVRKSWPKVEGGADPKKAAKKDDDMDDLFGSDNEDDGATAAATAKAQAGKKLKKQNQEILLKLKDLEDEKSQKEKEISEAEKDIKSNEAVMAESHKTMEAYLKAIKDKKSDQEKIGLKILQLKSQLEDKSQFNDGDEHLLNLDQNAQKYQEAKIVSENNPEEESESILESSQVNQNLESEIEMDQNLRVSVVKSTEEVSEKETKPKIDSPKESIIAEEVADQLSMYEQNVEQLTKFQETKSHEQLKYTNPLRDYSHILSGRLLKALIDTKDGKKGTKKQIAKLRRDVLAYQKDQKFLEETDKRMADAERMIERYTFGLNLSGNKEMVSRKFLLLNASTREIWHPVLSTQFAITSVKLDKSMELQPITVEISLTSLVPLNYRCSISSVD